MAEIVLHENSMPSATPARSALAFAAWIAPGSLSEAITLGVSEGIVFPAWSATDSRTWNRNEASP